MSANGVSFLPVVMAGEPPSDKWREWTDTGLRPHLPVGDESLLERTVRVTAEALGREPVVLGTELLAEGQELHGDTEITDAEGDLVGAIDIVQEMLDGEDFVLAVSCDLPLLETVHLQRFTSFMHAAGPEIETVYPVVRMSRCREEFPEIDRTAFGLNGERVTAANIFTLAADRLDSIRPVAQEILDNRKNPLGLARIAGLGLILSVLTGRLNTARVRNALDRITGLEGDNWISPDPEIATDVDEPEQWRELQKYLP